MTDLSIIIVNWNTKELLRQCIESIVLSIKYQVLSMETIVVDNASTDGSVEEVKNLKFKIENLKLIIIENAQNYGFAKGNNIGIKQARGKYIMLLNSDTVVKEGAIGKLVDFLVKHPEIAIVGPRLLNADGTPQPNCGRFPDLPVVAAMLFKEHFGGSDFVRRSPKISCYVDWLMGAAFIARKEVFEKAGGLDEKIFMYMEEVEWFYRAAKAGFKAYFLKEAEIVHLGRGSSKSGKTEPILNIYRGIIHFYRKHRSLPEFWFLKLMLKTKAFLALMIGHLKNDRYLIETYGQAFKIS